MSQPPYQPPPYGNYPPPQQPYGYGYPPPAYPPPLVERPGSGMAIGALVCGILAILSCWTIVGGILLGVIGAILGVIALFGISAGRRKGGGMAVTGIILSLLGIAASIVLVVLGLRFWDDIGGGDLLDCLNKAGNDTAAQQQCQDEFNRNIENRFDLPTTR